MESVLRGYVRVADWLADKTGIVAMFLVVVMILVLLLDAVTRNVIKLPLHWCVEFAQFTLAAYYFLAGPVTLKNNSHVRMDLFYDRLSVRGKHWMDLVTSACLIFYLAVLLAGGLSSLHYAIETNEKRFSIWNPSMIPIKALMVACIVLMLMQAFALTIKHAAALRGRPLT